MTCLLRTRFRIKNTIGNKTSRKRENKDVASDEEDTVAYTSCIEYPNTSAPRFNSVVKLYATKAN